MSLPDIVKRFGTKLGRIQEARLKGKETDEKKENDEQQLQLEKDRLKLDPGSRQEIDTSLRIRNQFRPCPTTERQLPEENK